MKLISLISGSFLFSIVDLCKFSISIIVIEASRIIKSCDLASIKVCLLLLRQFILFEKLKTFSSFFLPTSSKEAEKIRLLLILLSIKLLVFGQFVVFISPNRQGEWQFYFKQKKENNNIILLLLLSHYLSFRRQESCGMQLFLPLVCLTQRL